MSQQHEQVTLLLDRTSTTSATIRSTAVGVERLGLRYVDEIRIPDPVEDVESWIGWVSDDLLAASRIGGLNSPSMLQATVQFDTGEGTNLVVRYATLAGTGVVNPTLLRRRHTYPPGPFLLLDFDSYWQRPPDRLDEFDPELIAVLLDKLHAPVGETFQRTITERLREMLRKQP